MKVGILGGTFDPVHVGHLSIAEVALEQGSLDRILFVPAGHPRLKQAEPVASVEHRLEMVRLATANNPRFNVCDLEAFRPGPTYTVDTLTELSNELGPDLELVFILGLDVLRKLDMWKDPGRVLRLCQIIVFDRPGEQNFDWSDFYRKVPEANQRVRVVTAPPMDISATELRHNIAVGIEVEGQIPKSVVGYIQDQRLYRAD